MTTVTSSSHKVLIWKVFFILSVITAVEVVLGITKPAFLHLTFVFGTNILNIIFLTLTLVKAYYIVWFFMHLAQEKRGFRIAIVWTVLFLIFYLATLLLIEGGHLEAIQQQYTNWNY